jgi:hypothetical protein
MTEPLHKAKPRSITKEEGTMTQPFSFTDVPISHDTVKDLEDLTAKARRGEVTGLAYAVTTKGKGYNVNATGLLYDSPAFAIGTVVVLLYRLLLRATGKE